MRSFRLNVRKISSSVAEIFQISNRYVYKENQNMEIIFFDVVSEKSGKIPSTLTSTVAHKGHAAN